MHICLECLATNAPIGWQLYSPLPAESLGRVPTTAIQCWYCRSPLTGPSYSRLVVKIGRTIKNSFEKSIVVSVDRLLTINRMVKPYGILINIDDTKQLFEIDHLLTFFVEAEPGYTDGIQVLVKLTPIISQSYKNKLESIWPDVTYFE